MPIVATFARVICRAIGGVDAGMDVDAVMARPDPGQREDCNQLEK